MEIRMSMHALSTKTIEMAELKEMLAEHKRWLNNPEEGKRADLTGINLSDMNLSGLDFSNAIMNKVSMLKGSMKEANLSNASLQSAFFHGVDFTKSNIENADLAYSDISMCTFDECKGKDAFFLKAALHDLSIKNTSLAKANFLCASVLDCDFDGSDLEKAGFVDTDLDNTRFTNTNLKGACFYAAARTYWCDFSNSDMTDALLYDMDLDEKYLKGVKGLYVPTYCPEEGSFIAWKKCRDEKIVKLLIPEHAVRKGNSRHKLRTTEAVVLEIYEKTGSTANEAISFRDKDFIYKKGETVVPKDPDKAHCGDWDGIYFFLSKADAECFTRNVEDEDEETDE